MFLNRVSICLVVMTTVLIPWLHAQNTAAAITNPVTSDGIAIHMGDPFAFFAGGKYYLVGTTSE